MVKFKSFAVVVLRSPLANPEKYREVGIVPDYMLGVIIFIRKIQTWLLILIWHSKNVVTYTPILDILGKIIDE